MLTPAHFHGYQSTAVGHMLQHDRSMLWLGMGLGKTVITLTNIVQRIALGQIKAAIVFAPLRVCEAVWQKEALKWSHTKHLTFSKLTGKEKPRKRALFCKADVYLINYEKMNWLTETLLHFYIDKGNPLPFDMVVYDEISKLKDAQSVRFAGKKVDHDPKFIEVGPHSLEDYIKAGWTPKQLIAAGKMSKAWIEIAHGWKKIAPLFTYRAGLTGTPASNGYLDLFGQFLAVDDGARLSQFITHYKDNYFKGDFNGWGYEVTDPGKQLIHDQIEDITIEMAAEDYLELPECIYNDIMVDLPARARKAYKELEDELFTTLESGSEIEVSNTVSVFNKCLQLCNGSIYTDTETRASEAVHKAKLEALDDIVEEAAGQPILCSYSFIPDAERIMRRYNKKGFNVVNLTQAKASALPKIIDAWNSGKIQMLLGHPASMGHGVDGLQDTRSIIVWFGLNWSLELYEQMNKRIDRQGRFWVLMIHRILCNDSIDLIVADGLRRKDDTQAGLKAAMNRYRQGITTNALEHNFL